MQVDIGREPVLVDRGSLVQSFVSLDSIVDSDAIACATPFIDLRRIVGAVVVVGAARRPARGFGPPEPGSSSAMRLSPLGTKDALPIFGG
jgi:hypothetical protein